MQTKVRLFNSNVKPILFFCLSIVKDQMPVGKLAWACDQNIPELHTKGSSKMDITWEKQHISELCWMRQKTGIKEAQNVAQQRARWRQVANALCL